MPLKIDCPNCGQLLIDVSTPEAIKEDGEDITCQHCGREYEVRSEGEDVLYKRPKWKREKKATRYG